MTSDFSGQGSGDSEHDADSKPSEDSTWGQIFLKEFATAKTEEAKKPRDIVVNFPQGQKLTIRDLEPGTIVEVAAWKGKGLPGDEAVRMLFGANSPSDDEGSADNELTDEEGSDLSVSEMKSETVQVDQLNKDPSFDEAMGSRPTPHMIDHSLRRSRRAGRTQGPRGVKEMMKRIAIIAGSIAVLAGIVLGLRVGNLLYFEHPSSGVSTGLGGASTAVFAVNPGGDIVAGSTVVAMVDGEKVAVSVIQMAEEKLLVSGGSGQRVIEVPDVIGRVVFVVPFIGYLAGAF